MSVVTRELLFLILQFLDEEKFKETVHELEKESGVFFNMRYFEDILTNGEWDKVEKYLSGFTKVEDNRHSMKMYFEIRKQKYLEALDRGEHAKALEILAKDFKVFSTYNEELVKEITMLLTLNNFRENEQLSHYVDATSARAKLLSDLKKIIEANPLFQNKLQFPTFENSRLCTLINQSLNWQHQLCKNPRPNFDCRTLFVDHTCGQANGARAPSPVSNPLAGSIPRVRGFPPLGAHGPFYPVPAGFTAPLAGWMVTPSSVMPQTLSGVPMGLAGPSTAASIVKQPRMASDNPAVDYQTARSDLVLKRSRPFQLADEVNYMPVNILPVTHPGQSQNQTLNSPDDLPKTVVANLSQGSTVKSMDFHPLQLSWLLVGTNIGDISIWEVCSKKRLVLRNFEVWEPLACSVALQAILANKHTASFSVNRVVWSPDGALFGVAYSKHIVHIFQYHGGTDLQDLFEIDAHAGSVSDLAFSQPKKKLCIVTCGEDKTVKVWDAASASKLHTMKGHEAPVYSVCPHQKEDIPFIFAAAVDGKIKAWLYDKKPPKINYDSPGRSCITMAYTADGKRLFSCGTNKEGESFLVEWNENDGAVKRSYLGLGKRPVGIVQFDNTRNKYLAAGDEFLIKFWDMDNVNLLTTVDAEGGLPASPCLRFNKEGILLAVSTGDSGIKVLANMDGVRLVRSIDSRTLDTSRVASGSAMKAPLIGSFTSSSPIVAANIGVSERNVPVTVMNGDNQNLADVKSDIQKAKFWKLTEISDPSQLHSLRLPDQHLTGRIMRLMYTNAGGALLALAYNAVHKLWKWQRNERNGAGKATASVPPQLWTPASGVLMTNEIGEANPEEAVPCFALSKNDSYVMSASGGRISLFNMISFKIMTTCMPPPPAATSLAFHPQDNNIIAIGMDDSTIQIYNVRADEVCRKLKGHIKRVTGLTFSNALNILVSAGADIQICIWSTNTWEKQVSKFLQIPSGKIPNPLAPTRVQFNHDQTHILAVHETQVAIYEAPKLEGLRQWVSSRESSGAITDATFSCDSQSIYVSFEDGNVGILVSSTLNLRCMISPSAYLPSSPGGRSYPVALAAHPSEPNQFALGLTDGGVHVLEPLESEGKWGTPPPAENDAGPSMISAVVASDKPSR